MYFLKIYTNLKCDTWFTCTLMIHGDLGSDKFERSALLLEICKSLSFRTEGLITKLKWQTRRGRLAHPHVIGRSLSMMLCKPLSNLL